MKKSQNTFLFVSYGIILFVITFVLVLVLWIFTKTTIISKNIEALMIL